MLLPSLLLSAESAAYVGWPARDRQIAGKNLHRLAVLIECRCPHSDQASIGA
jgi:hypothetical protein